MIRLLDHDYGCDNGDRTFPHRIESAKAFVDFMGESRSSIMAQRARRGHGVYGVKVFDFDRPVNQQALTDREAALDPDGPNSASPTYSNKTVAVFVLDVRSHKTPWKHGSAAYQNDPEGDFLGERQWKWFERAIARSRASVNIIVNGLQVHGNIFPNGNWAESWGRYPGAQQRLLDAVLQDNVAAPILISGDVHMTQLMRKDCQAHNHGAMRPLVEMTTSGMTHSWGSMESPPVDNPEWTPSLWQRYDSHLRYSLMTIMHHVCPWTNIMSSSSLSDRFESGGAEGAKTGVQYSLLKNFGELEFDWNSQTVVMRSIGEDGRPLLSARWSMDQLSGKIAMPDGLVAREQFAAEQKSATNGGTWTCINHRGRVSEMSIISGHLATVASMLFVSSIPLLLPAVALLLLVRRVQPKIDRRYRRVRRDSDCSVKSNLTDVSSSSLDTLSDLR